MRTIAEALDCDDPDFLEAQHEALRFDLDVLLREASDDDRIDLLDPETIAEARKVFEAMRPAIERSWIALLGPAIAAGVPVEPVAQTYLDAIKRLPSEQPVERVVWLRADLKESLRDRARVLRIPIGEALARAVRQFVIKRGK